MFFFVALLKKVKDFSVKQKKNEINFFLKLLQLKKKSKYVFSTQTWFRGLQQKQFSRGGEAL